MGLKRAGIYGGNARFHGGAGSVSSGEIVLGYARVSIAREDLANQETAIREHCERKGYRLLKVFHDVVTGTLDPMERPGFRKMIEYATELGIHKVVVFDVSRLGRRLVEVVRALSELYKRGIVVEFVRHPELDTTNPVIYNTLILAFTLAAELEREAMKERMEAARRAGKRVGRKPTSIPWDLVEKYLSRGLNIREIYKILIADGYLRYKQRGEERVLSYEQFRRRVKEFIESRRR